MTRSTFVFTQGGVYVVEPQHFWKATALRASLVRPDHPRPLCRLARILDDGGLVDIVPGGIRADDALYMMDHRGEFVATSTVVEVARGRVVEVALDRSRRYIALATYRAAEIHEGRQTEVLAGAARGESAQVDYPYAPAWAGYVLEVSTTPERAIAT